MKKIINTIKWWHWKLTGYRELSELIRAMAGFNNALTPTGFKRANELSLRENHLRRLVKGIEK